jgi:hypothetical protein
MTINARIETALASIGCPVGFQRLDDGAYVTAFPSITYFIYLEQPEEWAEDTETARGYYVQVDIWAKENYLTLKDSVVAAMRAAEFGYLEAQHLTEIDNIYHCALRFKYTEFL